MKHHVSDSVLLQIKIDRNTKFSVFVCAFVVVVVDLLLLISQTAVCAVSAPPAGLEAA